MGWNPSSCSAQNFRLLQYAIFKYDSPHEHTFLRCSRSEHTRLGFVVRLGVFIVIGLKLWPVPFDLGTVHSRPQTIRVGAIRFCTYSLHCTESSIGCPVCPETICAGYCRLKPIRSIGFHDFGAVLIQNFPSSWLGLKRSAGVPQFEPMLGPEKQSSGIPGLP